MCQCKIEDERHTECVCVCTHGKHAGHTQCRTQSAFEACLQFKWTSGYYLLKSIFPHTIHKLIPFHMNAFRFSCEFAIASADHGYEATSNSHRVIDTVIVRHTKCSRNIHFCICNWRPKATRWGYSRLWAHCMLEYYFGIWMLDATINTRSFQSYVWFRMVSKYM